MKAAKRAVRELRVWSESLLVAASLGPVDLARACAALPRQGALAAPAKLALRAHGGAELRSELPRRTGENPQELLRAALCAARRWLAGGEARPSLALPESPARDEIGAALALLPDGFRCERRADGSARVFAVAFGASVRIEIDRRAGGAVCASIRSAVAARSPESGDGLIRFALEANSRMPLARLTVAPTDTGIAHVQWEALAPAGLDLELALPAAVEAVLGGCAATQGALRALGHREVASSYLAALARAPARDMTGGLRMHA
jgi:hypothetical protein